jgi:hypothetical protein
MPIIIQLFDTLSIQMRLPLNMRSMPEELAFGNFADARRSGRHTRAPFLAHPTLDALAALPAVHPCQAMA